VASPKVIEKLRVFLTADSLNADCGGSCRRGFEDTEGVNDFVKRNADDRQEFFNSAMLRMLMPVDSHANFVLTNVQHPQWRLSNTSASTTF